MKVRLSGSCSRRKKNEGYEQPIAFMSQDLQDSELKYTIMEKHAYSLIKSLKHFRTYIGYSKIIGYVPHAVVKDILPQQDCLGIRGKWVSKIQEYDIEIKPTKLIKGQGLVNMLMQGNEEALGIVCQNNDLEQVKLAGLQQIEKDL